jgi:hypothetical protein
MLSVRGAEDEIRRVLAKVEAGERPPSFETTRGLLPLAHGCFDTAHAVVWATADHDLDELAVAVADC